MESLTHERAKRYLLAGGDLLEEAQKAGLTAHLAACPECAAYAASYDRQVPVLKKAMRARWDPLPLPQRFNQQVMTRFRRGTMHRRLASFARPLAWAGALVILAALLTWSITALVLHRPLNPARFFPLNFNPRLIETTASDLNLNQEDLGPGWTLNIESNELDPRNYFTNDNQGLPTIDQHDSPSEFPFDLEEVVSFSQRGLYSQDDLIFSTTAVFTETSTAERLAEDLPNFFHDSDIPEENYTYQPLQIGDGGVLISIRNDPQDEKPFAYGLGFRQDRVITFLIVMPRSQGWPSFVSLSPEEIVDAARKVEARIAVVTP